MHSSHTYDITLHVADRVIEAARLKPSKMIDPVAGSIG